MLPVQVDSSFFISTTEQFMSGSECRCNLNQPGPIWANHKLLNISYGRALLRSALWVLQAEIYDLLPPLLRSSPITHDISQKHSSSIHRWTGAYCDMHHASHAQVYVTLMRWLYSQQILFRAMGSLAASTVTRRKSSLVYATGNWTKQIAYVRPIRATKKGWQCMMTFTDCRNAPDWTDKND
jgi:hypothetical protein